MEADVGDAVPLKEDASFEIIPCPDEENDFYENILSNTWQGSNSFLHDNSISCNREENESEVSDSSSDFSFLSLTCVIDMNDFIPSNQAEAESFKNNNCELNLIQEDEAKEPPALNSQITPKFQEAIYCPLSTVPSYQTESETSKNSIDELKLVHGNEAGNSVILKTHMGCKFKQLFHCPVVIQSQVNSNVIEIEEMKNNPVSENLALTVNVPENEMNSFLDQVLDNNENLIYQRFIKYKNAQNRETFLWDTFYENHETVLSDFNESVRHGNRANFVSRNRERAALMPGRSACSKKICKVVKHSLKLCKWFRRNKYIRTILDGAKTSFSSFLNSLEFEVNQLFGYSKPVILTVIGEDTNVLAIEEAFWEVFPGELNITSIPVRIDNVPTLPVGYPAALKASEAKMSYAREHSLLQENSVVVSATDLLVEPLPQRWQITTMLCLEDPNLRLHLHNFTASIPIPNEYVAAAERQTAQNYPLREFGFAVNIESAIEYCLNMDTKDAHEFLTGISGHSLMKSAAEVLAGMYKNYVKESV